MNNYYQKEKFPQFQDFRAMLRYCSKFGDRTFYKYYLTKDVIKELSYKAFSDYTRNVSNAIFALGLKDKKIAILSESRPEWLSAYIATICAKAVTVPLDKELLPEQIAEFIELAKCEAIFISPECRKKIGEALESTNLKYVFVIDELNYHGEDDSYEDFQDKREHNFYELSAYGKYLFDMGYAGIYNLSYKTNDMAAIIFTSGTTGTSKGVMLTQKNLLSCVYACGHQTVFTSDDVFLSVLPMHHTYECACDLAIYSLGATICINNSVKYFGKNVKKFKPTGLVLVPLYVQTMYRRVIDEIKKNGKQNTFNRALKISNGAKKVKLNISRMLFSDIISGFGGKLKTIICGGAALDPDLVSNFSQLGIKIYQGYGITECSPLVAVVPPGKTKDASVGYPIKCCDVKIILETDDCSVALENGEIGEIAVKGDNVMLGYFNNPSATEEVFTDDGYFKTGDLGYLDDDGFIYITGRKKNLIILANGKNVYPEEIEEYLLKLDSVDECAVVSRENELGEPVITAIIYPAKELLDTEDNDVILNKIKEDIQNVNKLLPSFKQIRNIEIRKTEFEKTSTRKIKRHKL